MSGKNVSVQITISEALVFLNLTVELVPEPKDSVILISQIETVLKWRY